MYIGLMLEISPSKIERSAVTLSDETARIMTRMDVYILARKCELVYVTPQTISLSADLPSVLLIKEWL